MIDGQPLSEAQDPMVGSGGVRRLVARWVVQGTLRLETAAHLGSGEEGTDVDMPLRRDRESGKPLLTGASLAGALRSYLADRLHGYGVVESSDGDVAALFGGTRGDQYGDQSPLIVFESIGEPPNAGIEVRDGVRIASAAGVAAEHAKYDVEVSPPGTCFPLRLDLLVSDSVAEAGLLSALVAALEGLAQGEIPLGARKTRGLGRCAVSDWHAKRYDLSSQDRWLEWLLSDHRQPLTSETPKTGSIAEAVSSAW